MRKLLELTAAARIPVFWILPPIRAHIQSERDSKGFDNLYLRRSFGLYEQFPNLSLVDARHAGFPDSAFFDLAHLNRSGAQALSAALGDVIGAQLAGENKFSRRVIELPSYRAVKLDPLPEDLDSSRVALGFSPLPKLK
jgi:hypothetical protein